MRMMRLKTPGRMIAVSPAHVTYVERGGMDGNDHTKVFLSGNGIPLRVASEFTDVVQEWQDALEGRPSRLCPSSEELDELEVQDDDEHTNPNGRFNPEDHPRLGEE